MAQQSEKRPGQQILDFGKRVVLFAAIDVAIALGLWLALGLFEGRLASPDGALLVGALFLFVLAMLPFFFDVGSTLTIPLRVFFQKKDARQILKEDRPRSEAGITLTFQFFLAGALVLLVSFLIEGLWGG
jgi:hypothetical protein